MNFIVTRQGLGQARPNKKQSQRGKNFRPQMPGHAADILHQTRQNQRQLQQTGAEKGQRISS